MPSQSSDVAHSINLWLSVYGLWRPFALLAKFLERIREVIERLMLIMHIVSSTDIAFMSTETKDRISDRRTLSESKGLVETEKRMFEKDVEVLLGELSQRFKLAGPDVVLRVPYPKT